jgi:hypothetical protein
MRRLGFIAASCFLLFTACDLSRETRTIHVVATPEFVQRQSCQAVLDAEQKPQEEIVLTGTAEHGHPDLIHVTCGDRQRSLIFAPPPASDDLGMKQFLKQWKKRNSAAFKDCRSCPKYNVTAKFVGTIRSDPADHSRLLYFPRTADNLHRKRIQYAQQKQSATKSR